MRNLMLFMLGLLLVVPAAVRAQDGAAQAEVEAPKEAVGPTGQIPKDSPICVRVKSLDRVDVIAKELIPILKAFGAVKEAAMLEAAPASALVFMQAGMDAASVDKTKPLFMGMTKSEKPVFLFHPAAAWEGDRPLRDGFVARLKDGVGVAGPKTALDGATRGVPTRTLDGDAVVHVYLGDLVEANKEDIENQFAQAAMQVAGNAGLPETVRAVVPHVLSGLKEAAFSVESFDYALTWKAGSVEAEGLLRTKPRTALRALLQRAGKPGDASDLVGYLPKDSIMTYDGVVTPDWPLKEMGAMIQKAVGEDAGAAIVQLLGTMLPFSQQLTGRQASAVGMAGMMNLSVTSLAELKEGVDPKTVFAKYDVAGINAALKKFEVPLTYTLEKAVAKHGEVELHRVSMASEHPMLGAALAMSQTYLAADNGHLFMVVSATAEDDIKILIDQVRKGAKIEHPHSKIMATLGREHNMGLSFNLSALKPLAMMAGMFGVPPELTQAIQNLPDNMMLATSITIADGDIHWRGNWPVKEIAKIAEAMTPGAGGADNDEDFD